MDEVVLPMQSPHAHARDPPSAQGSHPAIQSLAPEPKQS